MGAWGIICGRGLGRMDGQAYSFWREEMEMVKELTGRRGSI